LSLRGGVVLRRHRPNAIETPLTAGRDGLSALARPDHHDRMFALPAAFAAVPGLRRCGCCGGVYPRRRVRALAATPAVAICRDCARWAAVPRRGRRR